MQNVLMGVWRGMGFQHPGRLSIGHMPAHDVDEMGQRVRWEKPSGWHHGAPTEPLKAHAGHGGRGSSSAPGQLRPRLLVGGRRTQGSDVAAH